MRRDLELLQKIQAIAKVNEEIITRISNKKSIVVGHSYFLGHQCTKTPQFFLQESKEMQDVNKVLQSWIPNGATITPIEDFWNDKIDYSCTTFADICRLNKDLLRVAVKYRLLGGSADAIEIIEMFMRNFECLQVFLGSLEEKLMDHSSRFTEINQKVDQINQLLADIAPIIQINQSQRLFLVKCTFQNHWDQNGVLYWLGTNRNTTSWSNPYPQYINVTCFPPNELRGNLSNFVSRTGSENYVPNVTFATTKDASFTVDLKNIQVVPTFYTLRDSCSGGMHQLRNWNLEGSNDGNMWVVLRKHVNDTSIASQGDSASWKIDGQVEAFHMFRIKVTGPGGFAQYFFLFCSGFEIYGDVFNY